MNRVFDLLRNYFSRIALPSKFRIADAVEILILAFVFYTIVKWIKKTRAWSLVKGLAVLVLAWVVAYFFDLKVITWIFTNTITVGITAIVILFQPEFRKALEEIGRTNVVSPLLSLRDSDSERFSDQTLEELVRATFELAKNKTGALIVIEEEVTLNEFEKTGIMIDGLVTSQLLINIFEHNTPLHDGAVIIRKNRVTAATCYLPVSDNMRLSKELGTRHRAGVGVSEVADCLVLIVSEQTGRVSVAKEGELTRNINGDTLRRYLITAQNKQSDAKIRKKLGKRHGKEKKA